MFRIIFVLITVVAILVTMYFLGDRYKYSYGGPFRILEKDLTIVLHPKVNFTSPKLSLKKLNENCSSTKIDIYLTSITPGRIWILCEKEVPSNDCFYAPATGCGKKETRRIRQENTSCLYMYIAGCMLPRKICVKYIVRGENSSLNIENEEELINALRMYSIDSEKKALAYAIFRYRIMLIKELKERFLELHFSNIPEMKVIYDPKKLLEQLDESIRECERSKTCRVLNITVDKELEKLEGTYVKKISEEKYYVHLLLKLATYEICGCFHPLTIKIVEVDLEVGSNYLVNILRTKDLIKLEESTNIGFCVD